MTHYLDIKSDPKSPRVRSASLRKSGKDGTNWTPTERLKKNKAMKQFMRTGRKGAEVSSGNSEAYQANYDLIDWGKK